MVRIRHCLAAPILNVPFLPLGNPAVPSGNHVVAQDSLPASRGTRRAHGGGPGLWVKRKGPAQPVVRAPKEMDPPFLGMKNVLL